MEAVCLPVQVARLPSPGWGRSGQAWVRSVFNITDAWFYKDIIAIYILLAVVVMVYVTELKSTALLAMFCIQMAKQDIYQPGQTDRGPGLLFVWPCCGVQSVWAPHIVQ